MREIVLATRNKKKLLELKRLLKGIKIKVLSLDDFGNLPKVKEDGKTFEDNAKKKALEISRCLDKLVIADDSGLEVNALGNRPGVNSARYAHPSQNDKLNIAKLIKEMKGLPDTKRKASFKCVICLAKGRKVIGITEGEARGRIITETRGSTGFGYDPIFVPSGYKKTFAQLGGKIKDKISHRSKALRKAKAVILRYFRKYP